MIFNFLFNLANFLLRKLPSLNIESVKEYCNDFKLTPTESEILQIMNNSEVSKAAGVDSFPGKIFKDSTETITKPISSFCN